MARYEVIIEDNFSSAHALRHYYGQTEPLHGHNYKVRVTLLGEQLDQAGLLVDFIEVKRLMQQIVDRLDHQFINDIPPFTELNPSAENIARYFYQELSSGLAANPAPVPVRVGKVKVWETNATTATYRE